MDAKSISQLYFESLRNSPGSTGKTQDILVAINFRVPFEFRQRLKLSATIRGVTMTELITAACQHYLEDWDEQAAGG
ncbi:MAG: hypothetical protein ACREU3_04945 [Steroidobacteraceae bacterium]